MLLSQLLYLPCALCCFFCLRHDTSTQALRPWQLLMPCPAALAGSLPALLLLTRIMATTAFLLLVLPVEVRHTHSHKTRYLVYGLAVPHVHACVYICVCVYVCAAGVGGAWCVSGAALCLVEVASDSAVALACLGGYSRY